MDEKEADATVGDAQGGGRPLVRVPPMEEVLFQLDFGHLVGGLPVEIDEHPHGTGVTLLRPLTHAGKLQGSHGLDIMVVGHGNSPLV